MPGMSGTFKQIAEMSHINHSRKQQRSVIITLADLENVFGEVHHSLIQSVLRYHHIPDEINCIVKLLYCHYERLLYQMHCCRKGCSSRRFDFIFDF